ncbi:sulfurtransferase [Winogradskyella flava]|uniref:sulfurtransferase n=1 Tax=Winogradskyella flava TaxID=1884876 RepID=UPI002491A92D|nr:sulfurtransferase [Winogradskyella flava]
MSTISDFQTPLVTVQWLKSHISAKELVVLDATINKVVDSSSERIPSARFFDIKKNFSDIKATFPSTLPSTDQFQTEARKLGINNNSIIVVYDDKGIYSSARAWWLFKVFGFDNVAVLDGGLPEWKANGFNMDYYVNEINLKGNFEAYYSPGLMTDFKGVNVFSQDTNTLILDARSEARFRCLIDEPRDGLRRGTIPNSQSLPYTTLFNGYKLKSKEQLSEIFNNLVEEERILVFSCGSGITACILALAATQCGYNNLVVYDGSWTEYGTLTA